MLLLIEVGGGLMVLSAVSGRGFFVTGVKKLSSLRLDIGLIEYEEHFKSLVFFGGEIAKDVDVISGTRRNAF